MKDINLIPDKILYRKQRKLKKFGKGLLYFLLGAAVLFIFSFRTLQRLELEKETAIVASMVNNSALQELGEAEDRLNAAKKEKSSLEEVYASIPAPEIKATEAVDRMAAVMPGSVKATNILYRAETGEVTANLTGANYQDISLFLKRLHNDPVYADINMSGITQAEGMYRFSIVMRMK